MRRSKEKIWRPHAGPQTVALQRSEDELLLGGQRGGGKTDVGLAWMAEPEYTQNPMFRGLIVRRDANDLDDWLTRARSFYRGMALVVGNPPCVRWNKGGVIRTGHWKDKSTISKYIGKEFQKMLLEELTEGIHSLSEYKMLRASCRSSDPGMSPQIMANTNPGGPGHQWVRRYWVDIPERKVCPACGGEGCKDCGGDGGVLTGRVVTSRNQPYLDPVSGLWRLFIPFGTKDNPSLPKSYQQTLNDLPEPLRSAWRDGDWDVLEGQFFKGIGLRDEPWEIGMQRAAGRLYGSLDVGHNHPTSFGLWYADHHNRFHRLFTYRQKAASHRTHAINIRDRIETFRWTDGVFPLMCWAGHDAWTKQRFREDYVRAAIDEYEDVFEGTGVRFVRANNDRENGCQQMLEAFAEHDGLPQVSYWVSYNHTYEEDMQAMITDDNHPETYKKLDGDDTPDEVRYGLVGLRSTIAQQSQRDKLRTQARAKIRLDEATEYGELLQGTEIG